MGSFRRVEAEQAGPAALGILIPPGRRTFVILRPRGLPWDLLLCRGAGDLTFLQLAHDEASAAAQALYRLLCQGAVARAIAGEGGFRLCFLVGDFALVVCRREPEKPYQPLLCCAEAESHRVAGELYDVLVPPGQAEQEVYFNVRHFERPAG